MSVTGWSVCGAKGISEYLMLRLTRFRVGDFCEARSCAFVSPVLPQSPNEWWGNGADLEKLFSQTLSLSCSGRFSSTTQSRVEKRTPLGDEA